MRAEQLFEEFKTKALEIPRTESTEVIMNHIFRVAIETCEKATVAYFEDQLSKADLISLFLHMGNIDPVLGELVADYSIQVSHAVFYREERYSILSESVARAVSHSSPKEGDPELDMFKNSLLKRESSGEFKF